MTGAQFRAARMKLGLRRIDQMVTSASCRWMTGILRNDALTDSALRIFFVFFTK